MGTFSRRSPGKPYFEVRTEQAGGPNLVVADEAVQLAGRGYTPGTVVDIAVDGNVIQKVTVRQDGKFSATVQAPHNPGIYNITIADSAGGW